MKYYTNRRLCLHLTRDTETIRAAAIMRMLLAMVLHTGFTAAGDPSCPRVRVVYQSSSPDLINQSTIGTADNKYGMEDGIVVRTASGGFAMICAEMHDDPKWVAMRLGVWTSHDGVAWKRHRTMRQSSGTTDGNDAHAASWGPIFAYDPTAELWLLSYVGYRSGGHNYSGWTTNFEGVIYAALATEPGDAGLLSDFGDSADWRAHDQVLLTPSNFGSWYRCQGLQGTDSMYPHRLADGTWAAIVGTAHQEASWRPATAGAGKWPVSLATAPSLRGPWTRLNPASPSRPEDAPCLNLTNGHTENPIVSRLPAGIGSPGYLAIFDDLAAEGVGFARACSVDGLHWTQDVTDVVAVPGGVRTPFGILEMSEAEVKAHASRVDAYGVTTVERIHAEGGILAWLFYTQTTDGWERFRYAVVEMSPARATRR